MATRKSAQQTLRSTGIFLIRYLLVALCVVIVTIILVGVYLNSPQAPVHLSRMLTEYLRQPARITALRTEGAAITLTGVALGNPSDASPGDLCRVDSMTIAPDWGMLLTGKRAFRLLSLSGIRIDLRRNSSGTWNFSGLQKLFGAGKSSGGELCVKKLVIRKGALLVNGQGIEDVSLQLSNLSTKGSSTSRFELSFEDAGRNHYSLTGLGRPGNRPALDMLLSAPSLNPEGIPGLRESPFFKDARGALRVTAILREGRLKLRGFADFNRVGLPVARERTVPASGKIELAANYDSVADRAGLEFLTLKLNNIIAARAVASIDRLRKERRFVADLYLHQMDLAALDFLLPEKERKNTRFGGILGNSRIHLAGDAAGGVNSVSGAFLLNDAWLKRAGRSVFAGVNATLSLSGKAATVVARGKLSCRRPRENSLLENLEAPFSVNFSGRLRPLKAQIPTLTARIMGCAVTGKLGFNSAVPESFNAALRLSAPSVSRLNPLAGMLGVKLESGEGLVTAEVAGRGARDFRAMATVRLAGIRGTGNAGRFGITGALVDARLAKRGGILSASGTSRLSGLNLNGRGGDARFSYRIADDVAFLKDGVFLLDGLSVKLQRVVARLPAREAGTGTVGYPISADISGGTVRYGEAAVDGLSAKLRARLVSDSHDKWLEGESDISAGQASWLGSPVASPTAHFRFSRMDARGELGGTLCGGALGGTMVFRPFAPHDGGTFRVNIKGARMVSLGKLFPKSAKAALSGGFLDGSCSGAYSASAGVTCNFNATGSDIAVSGGSRTLFSGGGLNLGGSISRSRLELDKLLLSAGTGVTLAIGGGLSDPFTSRRAGRLVFNFPETPLNTVVDRFVNMLPRLVQEATVDGVLSASGSLVVKDGRQLLDGSIRFRNVLLDAPSQKLKVTEVNGAFPFSFDLSGTMPARIHKTADYTRENYPRLLEGLRKSSSAAQSISVGGVAFGPLELGETRLAVNAGNGVTRITSLRSSLYEGELLGSGYVESGKGLGYRGDLLINDLSLRLLCAAIPNIRDYISGRVDGFISLRGAGGGLAGLSGFTQLWAREGKGEKMLVSRVFLQKLSGKNLSGFFFRKDRPFDQAEIVAGLEKDYLNFETLDISHTNIFGVRDLSVTIAPRQNRIALDHLLNSIIQASARGKAATDGGVTPEKSAEPEFKWQE